MSNVEETIFEKPSGNVRGLVTAFMEVKGKRKRLAHATLLTDRAPDIVLDVPRKISIADIFALTTVLNDFSNRIQNINDDQQG